MLVQEKPCLTHNVSLSYIDEDNACISEGGYVVTRLTEEVELLKSYMLRHKIFSEELRWVPMSEDFLEIDKYDKNAVPFGVFNGKGELSAYMRLILAGKPFMLENEFISLVGPGHVIRQDKGTAEVSRLCVAPAARNGTISGNFGLHSISILLLKGVYRWCLENRIDHLYAVTEIKIQRLYYAKGFPFRLIGEPRTMPDGLVVGAMLMDWREFEHLNEVKRPKMFEWFTQSQSARGQSRLQLHGCSSPRRAFA